MRVSGLLALAALTLAVSGCAGSRHRQAINRLNTDVGLLDQRINQLERASLRAPQAAWPSESWRQPSPTVTRASAAPSAQPSAKAIQRALQNAGFDPGPIDGRLGSRTRQAITEFQRAHGLSTDGVVGKQTWARLSLYTDRQVAGGNGSARSSK